VTSPQVTEDDLLAETPAPPPQQPAVLERLGVTVAGLSLQAAVSAQTVLGLIAGFAVSIVVGIGAASGVAGICHLAGLPGAWTAGLGLGTFLLVSVVGILVLLLNRDRGLNGRSSTST